MTGLIDAHVHFWDRDRFDYGWLDHVPALRRSFGPEDLTEQVDGLIFVQADCREDQALGEASWIHDLRELGAPILGVVAHASLERDCVDHLEALAALPLVVGVRRLLQDEPEGFATADEFVAGVSLLERFGFTMDLCIRQHQLAEATELVRRVPGVRFVLDHLGKPVVDGASFEGWSRDLAALAAQPNVSCKLSGLLTEAPEGMRDAASLSPWFDRAVEVFGAERCMYGSDWPVLTLAADTDAWLEVVEESVLAGASAADRAAILGGTARRVYGVR